MNQVIALAELLKNGKACVLSGAGISTASGIPDYRGPSSRPDRKPPVQYQAFRDQPEVRAFYWARSAVGWPWMRDRQPNAAHVAVSDLQALGMVDAIITQNVDGLHQRSGSRNVLELHGTLSEVVCLECGTTEPRPSFQERIPELNPGWSIDDAEIAPDGDAEVGTAAAATFAVPPCRVCRGVLKPNVVFFGESVPRKRVDEAFALVDSADTLLVLGSSLTVFSGFRFVKHAVKAGKAVAIVNQGPTRADEVATLLIDQPLEDVLPKIARLVTME